MRHSYPVLQKGAGEGLRGSVTSEAELGANCLPCEEELASCSCRSGEVCRDTCSYLRKAARAFKCLWGRGGYRDQVSSSDLVVSAACPHAAGWAPAA